MKKVILGNPGMNAKMKHDERSDHDRFWLARSCVEISVPRWESFLSLETRVVTIPAVIEMRREGI